ncbi:hypothetical protein A2U01_0002296, partial [Trifolium medium]|nr:hypothetical protein [Trifolium medium]
MHIMLPATGEGVGWLAAAGVRE